MVFNYEKESSIFEDGDEFGLQDYRLDSTYIFNANSTPVKIIRYNEKKAEELTTDFLGTTNISGYYTDAYEIIQLNVMSRNPAQADLTEYGYDSKGITVYECFAAWDLEISNKDIIEFVDGFGLDIPAGSHYRIKLEDAGLYQGQYTRKQFIITRIENVPTVPDLVTYLVDESDNFLVDELGDFIIA